MMKTVFSPSATMSFFSSKFFSFLWEAKEKLASVPFFFFFFCCFSARACAVCCLFSHLLASVFCATSYPPSNLWDLGNPVLFSLP